jgi:hypothetical protein
MTAPDTATATRIASSIPGDPLVPLLPLEGSAPDPVAIATWHLALGSAIAVEVPHDLFALWLYPDSGGVLLLGPEALAHDRIQIPLPDPHLLQDQFYQMEEILRRAKYPAAIAVPVRHGDRDVAVMLLGSFTRGAFGARQALALRRLAARLAETLAELAKAMPSAAPHATLEPDMTTEALPECMARAVGEAASGPDLVRRVSGVLYPLLPHDRLEILALGATENAFVALSGGAPRRRWSAGGGSIDPFAAIVSRFGAAPTLLIDDFTEIQSEVDWSVGSGPPPALPARAVLGARMEIGGRVVGYLLLGSVAGDAYRPEDEETLALAALLVAPRALGFRLSAEAEGLRARDEVVESPALVLVRAAEGLATTGHLGEALSRFTAELAESLPHDGIRLHLRWGEDEVIEVDPEAPRPFADIPSMPVDGFEGAPVLRDERQWMILAVDGGEEVVVPLRVAGRTIGTLGVRGKFFATPRAAATIVEQFANVLAPHLELLRRGAAVSGPGARVRTP